MLYVLAEPTFILVLAILGGYMIVGKRLFSTRPKIAYAAFGGLLFIYIAVQSLTLGTSTVGVVLREIGFFAAPATVMFLVNRFTWRAAMLALITPVFLFLPSYLISGVMTVLAGSYEPLVITKFVLSMGDDTYDTILAFPYSLYIGGWKSFGPIKFHRATGFVREPGVYQILLIIAYFTVDILNLRYKRILKTGVLANIFLTFSTAGWGAFAASWLYFNVLSSKGAHLNVKAVVQRVGALLMSIPLFYFVLFAETRASVTQKLGGESGSVRVINALVSLREFSSSPVWGVGFRSSDVPSIHFIGVLAELGLIGVGLIVLHVFVPTWRLIQKRHPVAVFLIPLMLTTILAQPLFGKTMYFLILGLIASYPIGGLVKPSQRFSAAESR